jgi:hypothetical protein
MTEWITTGIKERRTKDDEKRNFFHKAAQDLYAPISIR